MDVERRTRDLVTTFISVGASIVLAIVLLGLSSGAVWAMILGVVVVCTASGMSPMHWLSPIAAAVVAGLYYLVLPLFGGPCLGDPSCEPIPAAYAVPMIMGVAAAVALLGAILRSLAEWWIRRRRAKPSE